MRLSEIIDEWGHNPSASEHCVLMHSDWRDAAAALEAELATIRRDGHAPPGKVLVDEGELRQRMKELASYRVCSSGRLTPAMREAEVNLLAHFGLAPEVRA